MNKEISTIFSNLKKYEEASKAFTGKGGVGTSNKDIQKLGKAVLDAMIEVNGKVTADNGPMNGLRCSVKLNSKAGGLGQGRAKGSNNFYLAWDMTSAKVDGVELRCYVAMSFILHENRTGRAKIYVGCGFWVKCDEGNYSERISNEADAQFKKFREQFGYPKDGNKFVSDDCLIDKDSVSREIIDIPELCADAHEIIFTNAEAIVAALKKSREQCEDVCKWMDDFVNKPIFELLESNKQIIFTGAPGTGKTYLAEKLIAPSFVKTKDAGDKPSERISKVQFHPGYDYSDFVIGLKPVLVNQAGEEVDGPKEGGTVSVTFKWKKGLFWNIAAAAKEEYDKAKANGVDPKKYVLIIDEINRADLSRVFGELFSQLESGYRYRLTKTQKEELKTEKETEESKGILLPNNERLLVPENLYIIGTMNDIDRSVESMDFAMRRRFGWHEVTAEASKAILAKADGSDSPLIKAMDELNKLIEETKGLGKAYHLGGAIFAKIAQYDAKLPDQERYELLWRNHIANTLKDYLRGNPKAADIFNCFKDMYDKCVARSCNGLDEETDEDNGADKAAKNDKEGGEDAKEKAKPGE